MGYWRCSMGWGLLGKGATLSGGEQGGGGGWKSSDHPVGINRAGALVLSFRAVLRSGRWGGWSSEDGGSDLQLQEVGANHHEYSCEEPNFHNHKCFCVPQSRQFPVGAVMPCFFR